MSGNIIKLNIPNITNNLHVEKDFEKMMYETIIWNLINQSSSDITEIALHIPNLNADFYQIVIYEQYYKNETTVTDWSFADLLRVTNTDNNSFFSISKDGYNIILLKGQHALNRFRDCLAHYNKKVPPQHGSLLDSLFLAYGCPVNKITDVHLSYREATTLIKYRFFCPEEKHTLGYDELPKTDMPAISLSDDLKSDYIELIMGYLQTLHRKNVFDTLVRLKELLIFSNNSPTQVKLFLYDLYMQIREQLLILYHNHSLSFLESSAVVTLFHETKNINELMQFLFNQFETVIKETGNPARNNVMDDLLSYIDHNYSNNLKLENIAPFFGYNSAYLGKLFTKTMGQTFNTYIDHVRIEESKELLKRSSLKVYDIAEKVGYRNVDYFHKKFRKYTGQSPAEFRKNENENK